MSSWAKSKLGESVKARFSYTHKIGETGAKVEATGELAGGFSMMADGSLSFSGSFSVKGAGQGPRGSGPMGSSLRGEVSGGGSVSWNPGEDPQGSWNVSVRVGIRWEAPKMKGDTPLGGAELGAYSEVGAYGSAAGDLSGDVRAEVGIYERGAVDLKLPVRDKISLSVRRELETRQPVFRVSRSVESESSTMGSSDALMCGATDMCFQ